jgi:hypothetical protein
MVDKKLLLFKIAIGIAVIGLFLPMVILFSMFLWQALFSLLGDVK